MKGLSGFASCSKKPTQSVPVSSFSTRPNTSSAAVTSVPVGHTPRTERSPASYSSISQPPTERPSSLAQPIDRNTSIPRFFALGDSRRTLRSVFQKRRAGTRSSSRNCRRFHTISPESNWHNSRVTRPVSVVPTSKNSSERPSAKLYDGMHRQSQPAISRRPTNSIA